MSNLCECSFTHMKLTWRNNLSDTCTESCMIYIVKLLKQFMYPVYETYEITIFSFHMKFTWENNDWETSVMNFI